MKRFLSLLLLLATSPAWAQISCTNLLQSGSASPASAYTTGSSSPASNDLILLGVVAQLTSGNGAEVPSSVVYNGTGLTFVAIANHVFGAAQGSGNKFRETLYRALGTVTAGTITINFTDSMTSAAWVLDECSGTVTTGTNGSGAIVQSPTNGVTSGAVSPCSVTMSGFSSSSNGTYIACSANSGVTGANGAGMTLLGHTTTGGSGLSMSQWANDNVAPATAAWSGGGSLTWGAVAVEIAVPGGGGATVCKSCDLSQLYIPEGVGQ
jgi:hypothetical protein